MRHVRVVAVMALCLLSVALMSGCILRKKHPDKDAKQTTEARKK